ncbi:MAG: hypothetical protein EA424_04655 [Planctomycetaceae bacterium]|nr:MAG: hypothetical protein EA424_04655 [Planctomycetaceae bacterium]
MLTRHNHTHRIGIIVALAVAMAWQSGVALADNADRIQPWSENPAYWQYQGHPPEYPAQIPSFFAASA